jgi:heparosan-N-sulfate-glucuronate 5-epimerase
MRVGRHARRAFRTIFSSGIGFEPQPPGRFFDDRSVRGYFIDFSAKTVSPSARTPELLTPADVAQLALGWWERGLAGDRSAQTKFFDVCQRLQEGAHRCNDRLCWPYLVPVPKYRLQPPWYSALAQGQIGSVFVRAHLATGRDEYAESAKAALAPLSEDGSSDLLILTPAGPILEEAPSRPPSHILNGWIYAVWGLWDAHIGLGDRRAETTMRASLECLRRMVDRYDMGWWTRYSLLEGPVADVAHPFYHRLHVDQLEVLYRLTGFSEFRDAGRRWCEYESRGGRLRALAHKGLAAAVRAVR